MPHLLCYLVNSFPNVLAFFSKNVKEKVNTPSKVRKRWERIDMDLRSKSLVVSIRRCQDANTIMMYGLSKSLIIKFPFSLHYSEMLSCNVMNFIVIL